MKIKTIIILLIISLFTSIVISSLLFLIPILFFTYGTPEVIGNMFYIIAFFISPLIGGGVGLLVYRKNIKKETNLVINVSLFMVLTYVLNFLSFYFLVIIIFSSPS